MTTPTTRWLDAAKAMHGFISDYRLCKELKVSSARMSNWRAERTGMDDDVAVKVASLVKVPAILILAELHAEKSLKPSVRKAWTEGARLVRLNAKMAPPPPSETPVPSH